MSATTFFFVFIPLLAIILLAINLIFAPHNPYQEKDSAFECGFHSFLGQNRTQFSISFFIFALLFLLFDLEILLVYPYVVSAYTNGIYGLSIMLIFFLALTLGFAFELGKNALKIDSRQMLTLINNKLSITSHISGLKGIYAKVLLIIATKQFLINVLVLVLIFVTRMWHLGAFDPFTDSTFLDTLSTRISILDACGLAYLSLILKILLNLIFNQSSYSKISYLMRVAFIAVSPLFKTVFSESLYPLSLDSLWLTLSSPFTLSGFALQLGLATLFGAFHMLMEAREAVILQNNKLGHLILYMDAAGPSTGGSSAGGGSGYQPSGGRGSRPSTPNPSSYYNQSRDIDSMLLRLTNALESAKVSGDQYKIDSYNKQIGRLLEIRDRLTRTMDAFVPAKQAAKNASDRADLILKTAEYALGPLNVKPEGSHTRSSSGSDSELKKAIALSMESNPNNNSVGVSPTSQTSNSDSDLERAIALSLESSNNNTTKAESSTSKNTYKGKGKGKEE